MHMYSYDGPLILDVSCVQIRKSEEIVMDADMNHAEPRPTPAEKSHSAAGKPWYRRRGKVAAAVTAAVLALGAGVGAPLVSGSGASVPSGASAGTVARDGDQAYSGQDYRGYGGQGRQWGGGAGQQGQNGSSGQESTDQRATTATSTQAKGVVTIDTELKYQDEEGAGTGMVLTSNGTVLTNNHVIEGATSIKVTVPSTGRAYTATVVGSDATDDVAVLKLSGASALATVTADEDTETTGQPVTAVGNAEGRGELTAASGTITSLSSSVTTRSEASVSGESLTGMLQVSADVVSGDSGGALLDAQNEVVGMDTAASSGTTSTVAYAIPIDNALSIAGRIEKGQETGGVTLGYPAFLGVEVASDTSTASYGGAGSQGGDAAGGYGASTGSQEGAVVEEVIDGTPAATAGMSAGDTITAVDGRAVASSSGLSTVMSAHDPGDKVTVAWTDSTGAARTSTVTLAQGPAA